MILDGICLCKTNTAPIHIQCLLCLLKIQYQPSHCRFRANGEDHQVTDSWSQVFGNMMEATACVCVCVST